MRFFRIRELFAPKNISAALLSLNPHKKTPTIISSAYFIKISGIRTASAPIGFISQCPPPYETYSFFTIRSDVVGFGTGSIILSIYVTP